MYMFLQSERYQKAKQDALELLRYFIDVPTFFLGYTDDDTFHVESILNIQGCELHEGMSRNIEDSYCGIMYKRGDGPLLIEDARNHELTKSLEITKAANIGSYLGVPIVLADGTMYGSLCASDTKTFHFQPEHIKIMELLAKQLGYVIDLEKALWEKEVSEKRNKYLAFHDDFTTLPNRRYLESELTNAIEEASHTHTYAALLMLNINRFKEVNKLGGHQFGDLVIKMVGERLSEFCRGSDDMFLARMGGDEYALLLRNKEPDAANEITEQVSQLFQQPFFIEERELFLTVSIGIASYPKHGSTVQKIITSANFALLKAKENWNFAEHYDEDVEAAPQESFLEIDMRLRQAIQNQELYLHYQPKFDIHSDEIIGAEALLRWNNPQLGNVPPYQFIPVLEETGLIVEVGEWVMREACRETKKLQQILNTRLCISINISVRQLMHEQFIASLQNILEETMIDPNDVELEITESTAMRYPQVVVKKIQDIAKLGCKISIDDFGTGYSSFSQVKQLPIHKIKIDRSFILDIDVDHQARAVVAAILNMAEKLGQDVIVEGVETLQQLEELKKIGCQYVQGYYYSPPVSEEKYVEFIKRYNLDRKL